MPIAGRTPRPVVPLTVIGGESGAGKTTVLMNLLANTKRPRVAAVFRDPDRSRLEQLGAKVSGDGAELPGGTVCCGFDGDYTSALTRISELPIPASQLLLELPSSQQLRRSFGYAYMPGFRPDGVILVISAATIARGDEAARAALPPNLHEANLIVLNKADLLTDDETLRARRWLAPFSGEARVVITRLGNLASPLVFGVDSDSQADDVPVLHTEWTPSLELSTGVRGRTRSLELPIGDQCTAWRLTANGPIDAFEFRYWVDHLPHTILRGNGVVWVRSDPHARYTFDLVGARWRLVRDGMWRSEIPSTRLMLVGVQNQRTTPDITRAFAS